MAQPGYVSCGGCGRLFKQDDPLEQRDFDTHDCDEPSPNDGPDALCRGYEDGWEAVADGQSGRFFWTAGPSDYLEGVRLGMEDARG